MYAGVGIENKYGLGSSPVSPSSTSLPMPTRGHPSDRLVDSYQIADNTIENEDGEKVVDLGDGFYNLDKGKGYRNLSREEEEYLSQIFPVDPDKNGRLQVKMEDESLYLERNGERIDITDDPDFNFGYFFPEFEAIAGGSTRPPDEDDEAGIGTKFGIGLLALGMGIAGVGGYSLHHNSQAQEESVGELQDASLSQDQAEEFHEQYGGGFVLPWEDADDYSSLELEFAKHWAENPGLWNDLLGEELAKSNINEALEGDYSQDGIKNRTAQEMGLNPVESYPKVSQALDHLEPEQASYFAGLDLDLPSVREAAEHIAENPEYFEAVKSNGRVSEIGVEYMGEFSPEVLGNISDLEEPTHRNTTFLDNLVPLPEEAQLELAEEYAGDGEITKKELNQAKFLSMVDTERYLERGFDPTDTNVSGDAWTNYFSKTQSDVIDWDVQNRRFVLDFYPFSADDYPVVIEEGVELSRDFYLEKMGIPENQVHRFLGESAIWENFQEITDSLEDELTEDDILVVSLAGKGSSGWYIFYGYHNGGESVRYGDIDEELDEVPAKQVGVLNACFSGSAIPRMEENRRTILASSGPEEFSYGLVFLRNFYKAKSEIQDGTYPSLLEAFEDVDLPDYYEDNMTPQISNPELAGELYLGQPED